MTAVLYRMFSSENVLLYAGSTMNMTTRIPTHIAQQPWADQVASVTIEHFETRSAVFEAEGRAIYFEKPTYNRIVTTSKRREGGPLGRPRIGETRGKPWTAAGMSRSTWYRRKAED